MAVHDESATHLTSADRRSEILADPGFGVDVTVQSDPKTLTAVWMGDLGLAAALSSDAIELEGPRNLVGSFPKWFGLHPLFADVDHPTSRPRVTA